ncbi:hypothetical protein [Lentibacillus saliphilus]|uniref:hypothetical protein n=1 Tax=Lentibacillus saliphilus TaxID=2737028 RepID=UPI001C2F3A4C|nr:hypothetical protein [Lentibacillus saliphilus]
MDMNDVLTLMISFGMLIAFIMSDNEKSGSARSATYKLEFTDGDKGNTATDLRS